MRTSEAGKASARRLLQSNRASPPSFHLLQNIVYCCGSRPMVPFWGRCTTHFRTYFSGDWDVHWGYGILTHGHISPVVLKAIATTGKYMYFFRALQQLPNESPLSTWTVSGSDQSQQLIGSFPFCGQCGDFDNGIRMPSLSAASREFYMYRVICRRTIEQGFLKDTFCP